MLTDQCELTWDEVGTRASVAVAVAGSAQGFAINRLFKEYEVRRTYGVSVGLSDELEVLSIDPLENSIRVI